MIAKKIVSFGFRHGEPPPGFVIDVRPFLRNPYHDRSLRKLDGRHPLVQADIEKTRNLDTFIEGWKALADTIGHPDAVLCVGCTGGHHRSVYVAERLGRDLGIPVEHRDLEKP
jgi:UPF0042 nucleotide-binding protein